MVLMSLGLMATTAVALDNGLAVSPPMGFRTWEYLGINVNASIMRGVIDAITETLGGLEGQSLFEVGYRNVAVDDGWQKGYENASDAPGINGGFHTFDGTPIVDLDAFPGGLEAIAAYGAKKDVSVSWYTNNCGDGKSPPETGYRDPAQIRQHYVGDVKANLNWGLYGFKVDGCGQFNNMTLYSELMNATGHVGLIESCHPLVGADQGRPSFSPNGDLICPFHYFRTSADVTFSFDSVLGNGLSLHDWENVSRPGCWSRLGRTRWRSRRR